MYIYIYTSIYICILDELSMYILITRTVKAKHAANKKTVLDWIFQKICRVSSRQFRVKAMVCGEEIPLKQFFES